MVAVIAVALTAAHGGEPRAGSRRGPAERGPVEDLKRARADLLASAIEYKESLVRLLGRQERVLRAATATVDVRRDLKEMGIVSQREVDESEQARVEAEERVTTTTTRLTEAEAFIVELAGQEHLAKLPALAPGGYSATAAVIRFNGLAAWSLATGLGKLHEFFMTRFGRSLPVSAVGQTPVHDRMGFDHREAVDVGLHPDSREGQALTAYLRSAGIPFQAFREAVPGSSTGAHIHVGKPSTAR
jgi:arginine repressor